MNVLVMNNLITTVSTGPVATPLGATVIDGGGRVLMPGLIDMHTHVMFKYGVTVTRTDFDPESQGAAALESMQLYLRMGYTTLRDVGGNSLGIARNIAAGRIQGPRLYSSGGALSGISGHGDLSMLTESAHEGVLIQRGASTVVTGADEMRAAVRTILRQGGTHIKLMVGGGVASDFDPLEATTFTEEEIRAAVEAAADFGTYVCAHAYNDVSVNRLLDAGGRCVEHGFLVEEETVKRMAELGAVMSLQSYAAYEVFKNPEEIPGFSAENARKGRQVNEGADRMMRWVAQYGVDTFGGADMWTFDILPITNQDLVVRKRWFDDVEILRQNTSNAAAWLAKSGPKNPYKEGPLGVIVEGAYADMILVEGNPLEDVAVLADYDQNIKLVMKDGLIFKNHARELRGRMVGVAHESRTIQRRHVVSLLAAVASIACTADQATPRVSSYGTFQPLPTGTVTRVAFGSCTRHVRDQPIWNAVVAADPDLFLHLGDAIYPDVNDEETALIDPWPNAESLARMDSAYARTAGRPEFTNLRENVPVMAVWDDHDYGINDGDREFALKAESQNLFLNFFGEPAGSRRRATPGIYDAQIFGPEGRRVQVILLDGRYFRTPPAPDTRTAEEKQALNISGRFAASTDPEATVLGEAQWTWLERQLSRPADLRLLVSGYPIVPTELGRDAWGNFPLERQRLFDLIETTGADGVVFLSGDVHFSEISQSDEGPYPMVDFTSSPLAAPSVGNEALANSRRISDAYAEENFGLVEIDWDGDPSPVVTLRVMDVGGAEVFRHEMPLTTLAPPR